MHRGALHVHSTYSDGEFSLAELRSAYLADGCAFACITDHADWLDDAALQRYRTECSELSDARFRFIPGLEYGCDQRMHIVGYGCTTLISSKDPQRVVEGIDALGGISVIAHPRDAMFPWIESFTRLPQGLEVWNSKYDGRYAPRPGTFALLKRLQARRPALKAFYGQDLHWKTQYRGLQIEIADASEAGVLAALAAGAFTAVKDDLRLSSSGELDERTRQAFVRAHARSDRLRRVIRAGKRAVDRLGIGVPPALKSQLRRVF